MSASHTPTPWVKRPFHGDGDLEEIYGADGELVLGDASMWGFSHIEDCDHALVAVNAHHNLVTALRKHAIKARERMTYNGGFAANGFRCSECKAEWAGTGDKQFDEYHEEGCLCAVLKAEGGEHGKA